MKKLLLLCFVFPLTVLAQRDSLIQLRLKELAIIKASWETIHPGLLRYNSQKEIDVLFEMAKKKVQASLSDAAYFILLSQLATKVKCGHTYLNPWNQNQEIITTYFKNAYIPFLYRVIDGKFIITHNLSEHPSIKPGDEITSINHIPVQTIIDSLLTVSRADGNNGLLKKLDNLKIVPIDIDTSNYSLFDIYFPLFFEKSFQQNVFTFEIKSFQTKKKKQLTANSLTKIQRQKIYSSRFGEIKVHEKNWSYQLLRPDVACLRIGDFEVWEWKADYKRYLDSIFKLLANQKIPNLIIDIRGNEGGDDEARTEVLRHIAAKPFGCDNRIRRLYKFLNIPDSLLPYLKTWNAEFKKPKNKDEYVFENGYYEKIDTLSNSCIPDEPFPNHYSGKVFLITDACNSSTTFRMADLFKSENMGLIVGEPTGGTKQGLNGGQYFFLRLPYSKMEIDLPLIYGAPFESRPDEAIAPDYYVPAKQSDIFYKRDTQVEFILNYIRKNH